MVFKSLKSINHIPSSQQAVEELLPCSSDENWDGEIQLKGSIAGCLLWEAYYLDFFFSIVSFIQPFICLKHSSNWLPWQTWMLNIPANQTFASKPSRKEGHTNSDHLEDIWLKRLCGTDQELR